MSTVAIRLPSASSSTKTAPRLARAPIAQRRAAKEEEQRRRRAEVRAAVLAFLTPRAGQWFTADEVTQALGLDHDPVLEQLTDLGNEEIDCRRIGGAWEYAAPAPQTTERARLLGTPGVSLLATRRARRYGDAWIIDLVRSTAPGRLECFIKVASTAKGEQIGEYQVFATEAEARACWLFDVGSLSSVGMAIPAPIIERDRAVFAECEARRQRLAAAGEVL